MSAFGWPAGEMRRVSHQVADLIADYLISLPDGPAYQPPPRALIDAMRDAEWAAHGEPVDALLAEFAAHIAPYPFGNGHPRFAAWVNSPPHPLGVLADALAAAMNPSVAGGDHAAVHLEHQVIRWFADLLGWPAGFSGQLVSGGSAATLTALAVAPAPSSGPGRPGRPGRGGAGRRGPVRAVRGNREPQLRDQGRRAARHRLGAYPGGPVGPPAADAARRPGPPGPRRPGSREDRRGRGGHHRYGQHRRGGPGPRHRRRVCTGMACGCTWTARTAGRPSCCCPATRLPAPRWPAWTASRWTRTNGCMPR